MQWIQARVARTLIVEQRKTQGMKTASKLAVEPAYVANVNETPTRLYCFPGDFLAAWYEHVTKPG